MLERAILGVDAGRRQIDAITDDGLPIVLTSGYLDAGHVSHGYAITGHKAQGLTCEHTYVFGSEALYREWGYVALSRGRQSTRLYQSVLDHDLDELHPHVHQPDDPDTSLDVRMTRTPQGRPSFERLSRTLRPRRASMAQRPDPGVAPRDRPQLALAVAADAGAELVIAGRRRATSRRPQAGR